MERRIGRMGGTALGMRADTKRAFVVIFMTFMFLSCSKQRLMGPLYEHQYKDMKKLEPPRMEPLPSPPNAESKVLHVRVYADAGYRRELVDWQEQIESLFGKVNFLFGEAYQLRLEVKRVSEWQSHADPSNMPSLLTELKALDAGEDVSWVVGFVTQYPLVTTGVDVLGVTNYLGKHIILRGSNSAAELQALHRRLDRLESSDIEALYQRRRVHQELYVFLHELGHSLGALHTSSKGLMAPEYEASNSWFTIENDELVRRSVSLREDRSPSNPALAKALESSMQDSGSSEWDQGDMERARTRLKELQHEGGGQKELATAGVSEAHTATADIGLIVGSFNSHLAKLELAKAEVIVADLVKVPMTAKRSKALWTMAQGYARAGHENHERRLLRLLREFVGTDESGLRPDIQVLRQKLAQRFYRLGYFSVAEELLGVAPDKPEFATLLQAMKETRERYGILAGSTSEDKEAEVLELIPKALKLGYSGNYSRANTLLSAGQRANPGVAGIATARCDLKVRQRQYAEAAKHCERAITLYKGSSRAHYLLGGMAYQQQKTVRAIKYLEKAISLAPQSDAAWKFLARVHRDAKQLAELEALKQRYQKRTGQVADF